MGINEKEALKPFLHSDHDSDDSRDVSIELSDLSRSSQDADNDTITDDSRSLTSDHDLVMEKPQLPKKPATYAIMFMLGAQVFSASMNVSIRLLENASTHLHPLQASSPVMSLPRRARLKVPRKRVVLTMTQRRSCSCA